MLSWNTEFQPCPTNHFNSIESQSDFKHQFYIWWKVMQIGHSDTFCGSFFFSLKTCTKLNHEKTEHQFFTLVPAGSTRKASISRNFFKFLLSKSDGFVIFKGASQKFAIFSENSDFPVWTRNFSSNQGGQSIRQTKGYTTRALIFLLFFPPFY